MKAKRPRIKKESTVILKGIMSSIQTPVSTLKPSEDLSAIIYDPKTDNIELFGKFKS